jgi:hypothetical protein
VIACLQYLVQLLFLAGFGRLPTGMAAANPSGEYGIILQGDKAIAKQKRSFKALVHAK